MGEVKGFEFLLGESVKEVVTGFSGVILGRTQYITGCTQYAVCNRGLDKEGKIPVWEWIDEKRLVRTGDKRLHLEAADAGPQQHPPQGM